ncbi:FAD-dependent oxidoreductase [Micromonospora sp. NPDC048999]|uniref:FAD-dependent oxidoreductase n=1 Tax=Micromonospora sp. NPDC048999 TaxID=3155391 RepID=UPI0033EB1F4F
MRQGFSGGKRGAACAYYASREGLQVTVLERGTVAGGTTRRSGGKSFADKEPGPELKLALASRTRWLKLAAQFGLRSADVRRRP